MRANKVTGFYTEEDDLYLKFAQQMKNYPFLENLVCKRNRKSRPSDLEMINIDLLFHLGGFTNSKHF